MQQKQWDYVQQNQWWSAILQCKRGLHRASHGGHLYPCLLTHLSASERHTLYASIYKVIMQYNRVNESNCLTDFHDENPTENASFATRDDHEL